MDVLYMEGVDIVTHTFNFHSHAHELRRACILYMEGVYFVYGRTEEGVDFVYCGFVYGGFVYGGFVYARTKESVDFGYSDVVYGGRGFCRTHMPTPLSHTRTEQGVCFVMEGVYFVYGRTEEGVDFVYGRLVYGGRGDCCTHTHNSRARTRCEEGVNCVHINCILHCIREDCMCDLYVYIRNCELFTGNCEFTLSYKFTIHN